MAKTILITGAGSGFGKAAAIGMARNGHNIIATVQVSPQVTPLREEAEALGLSDKIRVERLDLTDHYDIAQAQGWDYDVLWNNAGQGEAGPVWEIPVELVRRNYEVNVFLPLQLTQGVVQRWIREGKVKAPKPQIRNGRAVRLWSGAHLRTLAQVKADMYRKGRGRRPKPNR